MASENKPEPSSSSIHDAEDSVTMVEVLEEQQKLEEDANAVLGGSDQHNCTYDMGYINRQALYACTTCSRDEDALAGVCLACSYDCHEGHTLVELYTKRNFRCDCGNSKFPEIKCKLRPNKAATNGDNKYNHNFKGQYCTCNRPYPDPDDTIEDDMIQCIICEDWYHGRHLGAVVPDEDNFDEMTCKQCVSQHEFLHCYNIPLDCKRVVKAESNADLDVTGSSDTSSTNLTRSQVDGMASTSEETNCDTKPVAAVNSEVSNEAQPSKATAPVATEQSSSVSTSDEAESKDCKSDSCVLKQLQKRDVKKHDGALFWPENWRTKLCRCEECMSVYESQHVSYLLDVNDTVHTYEEKGKAPGSTYERGMEALSSMEHLQQTEVLHGYHNLKTELSDYLKKFADNKKVVREEDIQEFFSQLASRKRQRVTSGMSYFCK